MSKEQLIERLKENPLDRERWIEVGKAMGWEEPPYVFQFSYLDKEGKERFEIAKINDQVDTKTAMKIAIAHAEEHGKSKIQFFLKGKHANWHRFIDHLAEGKDPESFFTDLLTKE